MPPLTQYLIPLIAFIFLIPLGQTPLSQFHALHLILSLICITLNIFSMFISYSPEQREFKFHQYTVPSLTLVTVISFFLSNTAFALSLIFNLGFTFLFFIQSRNLSIRFTPFLAAFLLSINCFFSTSAIKLPIDLQLYLGILFFIFATLCFFLQQPFFHQKDLKAIYKITKNQYHSLFNITFTLSSSLFFISLSKNPINLLSLIFYTGFLIQFILHYQEEKIRSHFSLIFNSSILIPFTLFILFSMIPSLNSFILSLETSQLYDFSGY